MFFIIQCLEGHFPAVENVVAFIFSVKIPWRFAWKDGSEVKLLCFFINYIMKRPLTVAWTIPEFNGIVVISFEEFSEFTRDCRWIKLIGMWWWIKNSLNSMDKIHDNNNSIDIGEIDSLVNTTSYHKKFYFSKHDVYCMMNHLYDWTVVDINVRYWSGDIVLIINKPLTSCDTWT